MDKKLEKMIGATCLCCKYKVEEFEGDILTLSLEDGIRAYDHFDRYKDRTFDWKLRERYDKSKISFIESKLLIGEEDIVETYDVLSKRFGDKTLDVIASDKYLIEALVSTELSTESVTGEKLYHQLMRHCRKFDEKKYHLILVGAKLGYVDHIEELEKQFSQYGRSLLGSPVDCGRGTYRLASQLKDALERIEQELGLDPADRKEDISFLKEVESHKDYWDWHRKTFTWFDIDMRGK